MPSQAHRGEYFRLNVLHVFNDGYQASLALLMVFVAKDLGLALAQVGTLNSVLSVVSVVMALPAGWLATKFGGVRTIVMSVGVCGLVFLGIGAGFGYISLLGLFALAGVGLGVFHPIALALVSSWSDKSNRGRMMSDFTAIGDAGRIGVSTAVPILTVALGWRQTALLYGSVAVAAATTAAVWLRRNAGVPVISSRPNHQVRFRDLWRHHRTLLAMAASTCDIFASYAMYIFLPFLLLFRGINPVYIGAFTAVYFVGNLFGKVVLGRLVDRLGSSRVFIAAELAMAVMTVGLAVATNQLVIAICALVLGVFAKGTSPVVQTMLAESADHHGDFAKVFGLNTLVARITNIAVPVFLGLLADNFGIVWSFYAMAAAAMLAVIPAIGFMALGRSEQAVSS